MKTVWAVLVVGLMMVRGIGVSQSGASYGTQVNAAWFDRVAVQYQAPARDDKGSIRWPDLYPAVLVYVTKEGKSLQNPSDSEKSSNGLMQYALPTCRVYGEAGIAERVIYNTVRDLENAEGNASLKDAVVAIGQADLIYVEYQNVDFDRDRIEKMVGVAGNRRIPAYEVIRTGVSLDSRFSLYTSSYQARFKVSDLVTAGAIRDGIVTFQYGRSREEFCAVDLRKLP
jgi:hypothetical protein